MDNDDKNRKRKISDIPLCKYGLSCYQKNTEHHKKFKHPWIKRDDAITKDANENSLDDAPKIDEAVKPETVAVKDMPKLLNSKKDKVGSEETVAQILKRLPEDFFDFWSFCRTVNKSNPEDAFSELGYKLVGLFDLLAKKFPGDQKVDISCHWRYFYDPPEFQTVIRKLGTDMFHIGYFRDDPSKLPSILASNSGKDAKLSLQGDNIFAAMNCELEKTLKLKTSKSKATKLLKELQEFASKKKYSLKIQTDKTKERQKNTVAKTFHGLGMVVPVKNDIGYRPLPDSDSTVKSILKKIVTAENETKKLELEEKLDEIITNVHFANDECDYGMALELGIDLFCFGDIYFHEHISSILPLAYNLLQRQKYALVIKSHLKNRKKGLELSTIDV